MYGSNLGTSNVYQKYKMKVAFLSAGGIAPCLSASIGRLICNYSEYESNVEMRGYLNSFLVKFLGFGSKRGASEPLPSPFIP